jgi:hypothetical protein
MKEDLVIVRCFVILLCLFLVSCGPKQPLHKQQQDVVELVIDDQNQNENYIKNDYFDRIIQQEAMLVDVPIPLFDERIFPTSFEEIESDTSVFGYKSPLSKDQAIDFFLKQMERLGWEHLISFKAAAEIIMQFKSPDRYCTVVIKDYCLSTHTSIFMYIKRASIDACS